MNHLLSSRECALNLTKDLSELTVKTLCPAEEQYFPAVWDVFCTQILPIGTASTTPIGEDTAPWQGGLPFAADQDAILTPIIILIVWNTLCRVNQGLGHAPSASPPDKSRIDAAILSCSQALGVGDAMGRDLVATFSPLLYSSVCQLLTTNVVTSPSLSSLERRSTSTARNSVCIVRKELDKHPSDPETVDRRKAESSLRQAIEHREYDLIVDEVFSKTLTFWECGRQNKEDISLELSIPVKGMLWLVMTHVDDYISHKVIRTFFGCDANEQGAVYLYPSNLRTFLCEPLGSSILPPGKRQRYYVPDKGWSFCWLRRQVSERASMLLEETFSLPP